MSAPSAIINGIIDTENPAAVAFGSAWEPFGTCSGTIIKVEGEHGWALTAAHCADNIVGNLMLVGHLDESPLQFPVVEVVSNPAYFVAFAFGEDVAVVRFVGADPSLPVVSVATAAEDDLAVNTTITLAGYGRTEDGVKSQRRSITRPILLLGADLMTYDQATGGICFGDSGGPAFAELGVGRRVVGVTSVVTGIDCDGWGGSARASAHLSGFIQPLLDKPTFDACSRCYGAAFSTTACQSLVEGCFAGGPCELYSNCVSACSDAACRDACGAANPQGEAEYGAIAACPCEICGESCQDQPTCGGSGTGCGFVSDTPACTVCIEGCCAESAACVADSEGCGTCFPNCGPNPASAALLECLEASTCVDLCGLNLVMQGPSDGDGGGDGGGGEAGQGGAGHGGAATVSATGSAAMATSGAGAGGSQATSTSTGGHGGREVDDDQASHSGGCSFDTQGHDGNAVASLLLTLLVLAGCRRRAARAAPGSWS